MATSIMVTGGTGTVGRKLVPILRAAGVDIRVLSRHDRPDDDGVRYVRGDLAHAASAGPGRLVEALDGVDTVVHLAGDARHNEKIARGLVEAVERSDVSHVLHLSVVGADRIPPARAPGGGMLAYYPSKAAAERVVDGSPVPSTTLRATQFHELALAVARIVTRSPLVPAPSGFRFQTIAAREVAERVAELALGPPAGRVPDLAGPQVRTFDELLRSYVRATGERRVIVPLWTFGKPARAYRRGANLALDRAVGRQTWEEFLAQALADA